MSGPARSSLFVTPQGRDEEIAATSSSSMNHRNRSKGDRLLFLRDQIMSNSKVLFPHKTIELVTSSKTDKRMGLETITATIISIDAKGDNGQVPALRYDYDQINIGTQELNQNDRLKAIESAMAGLLTGLEEELQDKISGLVYMHDNKDDDELSPDPIKRAAAAVRTGSHEEPDERHGRELSKRRRIESQEGSRQSESAELGMTKWRNDEMEEANVDGQEGDGVD